MVAPSFSMTFLMYAQRGSLRMAGFSWIGGRTGCSNHLQEDIRTARLKYMGEEKASSMYLDKLHELVDGRDVRHLIFLFGGHLFW